MPYAAIDTNHGNLPERSLVFMASSKNTFDRIDYWILRVTLILLALIGAIKLVLAELKSFLLHP